MDEFSSSSFSFNDGLTDPTLTLEPAQARPQSAYSSVQAEQPVDNTVDGSGERTGLESKVHLVIRALRNMEQSVVALRKLLEEDVPSHDVARLASKDNSMRASYDSYGEGRVIEGVFDGSQMVGSDGKPYTVPPNYASKSKLVEGDMMKLTITPTGTFIYKQIGPIERDRVVGVLGFDETVGEYYVARETDKWRVLKASVTYYKGQPGDEVVVLVPKDSPATWAAVENIIVKEVV
jgi:hypothetical protein